MRIFVKYSDPSSRKALKEISIEKSISIALLSKASWLNSKELNLNLYHLFTKHQTMNIFQSDLLVKI